MMPSAKILNSLTFKGLALLLPLTLAGAIASPTYPQANPPSKNGPGRTLTVRSDIQEADSKTGIVTARGNVQINYPSRQIQATATQAQYFSRERRIVLRGDVYVLQEGNSLRGETVTYLIDEGRFIALPESQGQVESIYIVSPEQDAAAQSTTSPETPPYNPKPAFKTPMSPPTAPRQ
ncbi:LptA/OstA family protein [Kamptonema sp. UHCC 0994]|uniref:LptA/OstA family protein n=1 Tax=Kamptonema sp. UHCC 0994 TaxID=3031329 RepID=UPI0023B92304|nr:LptA/OstA family protein [Kamptonema sp. UHCC 0994]MDF0552295.1 LptA/OstA family protein [Kamptonema sp. UHCC 0994]